MITATADTAAALAEALRSPAAGVAVPVAADGILRWLRDHPDPSVLG